MDNKPVNFSSMNQGLNQEEMMKAFKNSMPQAVEENKEVVEQKSNVVAPPNKSFVSDTFSQLLNAAEAEDEMIRSMGGTVEKKFDPITQPIVEDRGGQLADVTSTTIPVEKKEEFVPAPTTQNMVAIDKVEPVETNMNINDILKNISIDVNNIELTSAPVETLRMNRRVLQSVKTTSQIVACQSAIKAYVSALSSQEIQNLIDADTDFYSFKKMMYQIIHKHIEDTSVGKIDFPTFLKTVSFFDIDTFLYGIYCQTFPYENKYTLTCPGENCGKDYPMIVNNRTLVETRGQDGIFERIDTVVANVRNAKDLEATSLLYKVHRAALTESKMIVEIQIPSLHDYLEGVLANTDRQFAEEYAASMGLSLFIRKLYVPDLVTLRNTGKLTFFEITDKKEITMNIAALSFYDGQELSDAIDEYTGKFKVSYSIKNVTCPHCAHVIKEIPINIEQMLFHVIRQGRPKKDEKNEQDI